MSDAQELARVAIRAAMHVCEFQWHLFLAHEDRAAGKADRAAAHVDKARAVMESVQRTCRDLGPRTSANE